MPKKSNAILAKDLVKELRDTVDFHKAEAAAFKSANEILEARVKDLEEQLKVLTSKYKGVRKRCAFLESGS